MRLTKTIFERTCRSMLSQSPNRRNRLYLKAHYLEEGLAEVVESRRIDPMDNLQHRCKVLREEFDWSKDLARIIWLFGLEVVGPNILIDACKGGHMNEIKEIVICAFKLMSAKGKRNTLPFEEEKFIAQG
ncbi:elongation factor 2-like [Spinacia oleracea]|uniref:Elongation factor 2-like n=1 Tax=Spinacia oleracea TaxID=3562 RepID=A0ABM3R482_SPIOL|nr:elongation factor 2-like [Spinacia oleracea]